MQHQKKSTYVRPPQEVVIRVNPTTFDPNSTLEGGQVRDQAISELNRGNKVIVDLTGLSGHLTDRFMHAMLHKIINERSADIQVGNIKFETRSAEIQASLTSFVRKYFK